MTPSLTAHLLQSTLFAAAAGLLTLAFRRNRAQVRYWLWLSVSLKFIIPFALLMSLGSYIETRMPVARRIATRIATPAVSYTLEQFSDPKFTVTPTPATAAPDATQWIPTILFAVWLCGFIVLAFGRFRSWVRVRRAVRAGTPMEIDSTLDLRPIPSVVSTPSMLEPGVAGILRPTLLLPEGIADRLTPSELKAVLAHELCHIRRRDNLFAAIHMSVETIFWFHPLIWWIGARLVEERERACDEEVLRQGNEPDTYADAILNVCKLYVESPLACVSGVSGAGIRRRIEAIMLNRRLSELNRPRKFLLAGAGVASLAGPVVVGLLMSVSNVRGIYAKAPGPPPPPMSMPYAGDPVQKFEAASIERCDANAIARGGPGSMDAEGGGLGTAWSPGRIARSCVTTMTLLEDAYARFADGRTEPTFAQHLLPVNGAPSWVTTDRYTIQAAAKSLTSRPTMLGPMMRSLLEERFGLKYHYETRIVPTWELTVADGGSKLIPAVSEPGNCEVDLPPGISPKDSNGTPLPAFGPDGRFQIPVGQPGCHLMMTLMHGRNNFLVGKSLSLGELSEYFVRESDRPVIDKTGLQGRFDVVLEFAPGETGAPDMPGLTAAVEQRLGLNLVASTGPRDFLVIDHIGKPSQN